MRTSVSTGAAYCSLVTRPVVHQRVVQSSQPPGRSEQLPPSRQILHETLVERRLQQQRDLVQQASLQQQEEDAWLQSAQAEADADAWKQYQAGSADFMQNNHAAASQRPPEASKRSQQLGTTKLGRQRLQTKANSFADMVQLVALADVEHSEEPMVSSGNATAMEVDAANHGTAVSNSHDSEPTARSSRRAADRNVVPSLTRANRQRTTGSSDMGSPPTAPGDLQPPLQQVHNTSTQSLSLPNHRSGSMLKHAGHADDTSPAMPQSNQSFPDQEPLPHRQHDELDRVSSPVAAEGAQTQTDLARSKYLQRLEAAAASWRQRCGSSNMALASQSVVLDSNQTGLPDGEVMSLPAAQSWQPQHTLNNLEAIPPMPESVDKGGTFGDDAGRAIASSEYDDQEPAFAVAMGIPPPPTRPSQRSQARNKASWAAALRGDAPPWLL